MEKSIIQSMDIIGNKIIAVAKKDGLKNAFENIYTYTGTLIHKFYKIIIKNQLDIDIILRDRSEYFKQLLSMQSYSSNERKQAYQIIVNSFKSLKDCEDGKWLYQLHDEDRMEVEYHIKDSNKPRKIPDRTFIYDDARWIIDYKAVFSEKDFDLQAKEYLPQLDQYEKLFNDKYINKKVVSILEGGYDLNALADSADEHIKALQRNK